MFSKSARHHSFFQKSMPRDGIIIGLFALVMICLGGVQMSYINCWPEDSCITYIPTAAKLSLISYPSQMHSIPGDELSRLNMHGKETLILSLALMQRILRDPFSLFPNIFILIVAVQVSGILIFFIVKRILGKAGGWFAFFIFTTTFWPYQYVLFGAHQPLVLMNFLLTLFLWQQGSRNPILHFLAGLALGFMLFSSPTSFLYFPYFLIPFLCGIPRRRDQGQGYLTASTQGMKHFSGSNVLGFAGIRGPVLVGAGCWAVILFMIMPDPAQYFQEFKTYLLTNQGANHFQYYQNDPARGNLWPDYFRGQGPEWIFKYMFLILPVLFPMYLLALIYLLIRSFQHRVLILLILVSLSTPLSAETAQVAQFGRNYFSWFPGIIFVLAYVIQDLRPRISSLPVQGKRALGIIFFFLLGIHLFTNMSILRNEIFIPRLATTHLRQWLNQHQIQKIYVYQNHPRNIFTADVMNNPKWPQPVKFFSITSLTQPTRGLLLVPPKRARTIWNNCMDDEFTADPALNWLYETGYIEKCSAVSFPSIASSRIWAQEEEICTHLDHNQGLFQHEYQTRESRTYLLDIRKAKDILRERHVF